MCPCFSAQIIHVDVHRTLAIPIPDCCHCYVSDNIQQCVGGARVFHYWVTHQGLSSLPSDMYIHVHLLYDNSHHTLYTVGQYEIPYLIELTQCAHLIVQPTVLSLLYVLVMM